MGLPSCKKTASWTGMALRSRARRAPLLAWHHMALTTSALTHLLSWSCRAVEARSRRMEEARSRRMEARSRRMVLVLVLVLVQMKVVRRCFLLPPTLLS